MTQKQIFSQSEKRESAIGTIPEIARICTTKLEPISHLFRLGWPTTLLRIILQHARSNGRVLVCLAGFLLVPQVSAQTNKRENLDPLHQLNDSVRALVKRVAPTVVQVIVTGYGPVASSRANTSVVIGKQQSVGSGVVIDADGYILTNAHVVRGARLVLVNLPIAATDESPDQSLVSSRGRTLEARIVGSDTELDLALLKIEAKGLPRIPLADYNKLRQGEVVFAFGSPEGLQNSVS